jgi:type I restriction enzyme S subunit
MKSNYKKLGQYIESFDFRNKNSSEPLGLDAIKGISSIYKSFIKTKANLVGVSPENYKVVKPNQFGFNPNTARMGDKIPIALNVGENDVLVSSIYPTFKIINENELLPEYLMMWFKRPEFDRYARFKSHGSAREIFDFDEMRGVELPVPSIEKQREIVKEYNTIFNRIKLNEQLNQKLEETAQALYKHWFVDFEFPNENGQPYKSSGGQLVYNEELDQDIPYGWHSKSFDDLIDYNTSNYSKKDAFDSIYYLDTSSITNNKIEELQHLIIGKDTIPSRAKRKIVNNDIVYSTVRPNLLHYGLIKNPPVNMLVSTGFMVLKSKDINIDNELLFLILTSDKNTKYLQSKAEMSVSTYPSIKPEDILAINSPYPKERHLYILADCKKKVEPIYNSIWLRNEENKRLVKIKEVLLQSLSMTKELIL